MLHFYVKFFETNGNALRRFIQIQYDNWDLSTVSELVSQHKNFTRTVFSQKTKKDKAILVHCS